MRQKQYLFILLMVFDISIAFGNQIKSQQSVQLSDADRLNIALEYFQSEKYHEALLLFQYLDQKYLLNSRYRAYMGLCYYHDWKYKEACQELDSVMTDLKVLAPHEQAVYYYSNAESHFYLKQYSEAIPCYERMLNVCYLNEKADAFYRLGLCYLFNQDWINAHEYLTSSLVYYQQFGISKELRPRISQIKNMIKGTKNHFTTKADTIVGPDNSLVIVIKEM